MMRMVDVIWCVDKARWKRETYRVSLIHPLETNNSQAYKNMIWSKWVIKIRFCLTGASSSIDPSIPPLTSSLCCCNEFLPFPRLPSIPKRGPVTESNKSCTNNTKRQICYQVSEWCLLRCVDVEREEGGRREVGGQVTQDREHRNTGALAMSNLTLLYPTIHRHSPPSPPLLILLVPNVAGLGF